MAAWLLLAPAVLGYDDPTAAVNSVAAAAGSLLLAFIRGPVHGSYGGGWRALWKPDDDAR